MNSARRFRNPSFAVRHGLAAILPALLLATGCGENGKIGIAPRNSGEALDRINSNADRINAPLYAKVNVSLKFRDENGKTHRILNQDGYLAFQAPRCLRLDLKSLTGVIGQLGSNNERYWVWIEPELNTLWWGRWANASHDAGERLPVPPTDLLETLLLSRLPEGGAAGRGPELKLKGNDHRLVYNRAGGGTREVRLLPGEPYLPAEIIDRDAKGEIWLHAELSNYDRIGKDGPYTPRKYHLSWPHNNADLRIDVASTKFRTDLEDFCDFPSRWTGQIEAIDQR